MFGEKRDYSRASNQPTNFFPRQIIITAQTGVGSSTTVKYLLERLGSDWQFRSGGVIMRSLAAMQGMTIEEFAEFNMNHPEAQIDRACDNEMARFGLQDGTLLEGRLPHVFAPQGFHVLLTCPVEVRARRRHRQTGFEHLSLEEIRALIVRRDEADNTRYSELYPGCLWLADDFDLVVGTDEALPEEVVELIISGHQEWVKRMCQL